MTMSPSDTNPDTDCSKELDDIILHIRVAQEKRAKGCEKECEKQSIGTGTVPTVTVSTVGVGSDRDVEAGFAKAAGMGCDKTKTSTGTDTVTAESIAGIDASVWNSNSNSNSNININSKRKSKSKSNKRNNNCKNNSTDDTAESSSSSNTTDQDAVAAKQQSILRTTPGAFAIHNPLFWSSSSSSTGGAGQRQGQIRPHVEQRLRFLSMTSLGSYASSLLGIIPETTLDAVPEIDLSSRSFLSDVSDHDQQKQQHHHTTTITPCVTAVCVGNDSEIYEGKIVDDHPNNNKTDGRMKRIPRWLMRSLLLILLGFAVALGIVLNTKEQQPVLGLANRNNERSSSSSSSSISPEQQKQQRKDYLISLLAPISGPAGARVFDRTSKDTSMDRIAALDWLVNDTENLVTVLGRQHHDDSSITTRTRGGESSQLSPLVPSPSPSPASMVESEWKILQRYVLALLFFATDGDGGIGGWDIQCSFLSRDDECLWNQPTPIAWQEKYTETTTILDSISDTTGVTCNEDGRVRGLTMRWNDLSGTLPHELFYLKDTLEEIDFGNGSISGTIPSSFGKLTGLKGLALDDNCLGGTIPENLSTELSSIERVNMMNNPNLYGSFNGFCHTNQGDETSNRYREGILSVAGDCGVVPHGMVDNDNGVECECCICCDDIDKQCHDQQSGNSWKSYNSNILTNVNTLKFFRKKVCRPDAEKDWMTENCPCYIDIYINNNNKNTSVADVEDEGDTTPPFLGYECTKDCAQEGAQDSIGWPYKLDFH